MVKVTYKEISEELVKERFDEKTYWTNLTNFDDLTNFKKLKKKKKPNKIWWYEAWKNKKTQKYA